MSADHALCVFARAIEPGRVKTRLIGELGPQGAADLYRAFVGDVFATCAVDTWSTVTVHVAGEPGGALGELIRAAGFLDRRQVDGDLGDRMRAALQSELVCSAGALLVGTDLPTLPAPYLALAAGALQAHDLVLGPSADGGYYLIGVGASCGGEVPDVFRGVPWSCADTLSATLAAARRQHLNVRVLPPWYDVDGPRDLWRLRTHLRLSPSSAPRTAEVLGVRGTPDPF